MYGCSRSSGTGVKPARRQSGVHVAGDRPPRVGQHAVEVEEHDLGAAAHVAGAASSGSTNVGASSSSGFHWVFGAIARVTTRSL